MKRLLLIMLLLPLFIATSARAETIEDVALRVDEAGATLELTTPEALAAPRVRISAGSVRLWFANVANDPRVERRGDGGAIRWAKVWPGVNGSSAVHIRLGDSRRLDASSVVVSRVPGMTRVHIPASALPARRDAPAATPEAAPAPAASGEEGASAAAEDESAEVTPATSEATPHTARPEPRAAGLAPQPATGSSGFVLMLLVTVLLGSVYGVVRFVSRKRGSLVKPEIEVVSSKRLGPRHQLVVVRALGEDHLLSINRGETERLASVPTREDELMPQPEPEAASDLLGRLREGLGLRMAEPPEAPTPEAPKPPLDDGGRFGSQLMRAAAAARYGQGAARADSEAVAGLMRLRERAER